MRVLLTHRPGGAYGYITDGWLNALRDKGHTVERWDGNEGSWRDFNPTLYIGCSGHKQPIPPRRTGKVAIHVNPYGPVNIPGINENDQTIRWTLTQKPDAVFGYGHEEDRIMWSYWTQKHNIPWVPMPTAGDRTMFKIMPDVQKQYDLVYLGGRWTYKAATIDPYLLSLLTANKLSYKLHGWGDWPAGICSGILSEDQVCRLFNSGKVGPCIAEQHTHTHGIDIPERAFKVALCGALVVHDPAISIKKMIPSAVVATTPQQFHDYCYHFCDPTNEQERIELADKQRTEVLTAHTYHHRLAGLFLALGFNEDAKNMLS